MYQPLTPGYFFTQLLVLFGFSGAASLAHITRFASHLWLSVIVIGYLASLAALVVIVYTLVRLYELRKREEEYYGTVVTASERENASPRWQHIEALSAGGNPSEWREAIIEADIMLDDMLSRQGYAGDGVGEKLMQVERADFGTLNDAWEAHKVRNQVAHQGSAFDLSDTLAKRTIAHYEAVFREFGAI